MICIIDLLETGRLRTRDDLIYVMDSMAEQSDLIGSHLFLDRLALAFHLAAAARLLLSPESVLAQATDNLKRWLAMQDPESGAAQSLREWQVLIDRCSTSELIRVMTEDSDEGQRLRQSSPFTGILSDQERAELIALCEQGTVA